MANRRNDHEQHVDRILKSTDYFSLLCLKNTCSEKELTTAYRNLALKVHPDKTKTPRADKAFRALQEAYDTLKDPTKRLKYVEDSTRQRPSFTNTRETDENNTDPLINRTQFTPSRTNDRQLKQIDVLLSRCLLTAFCCFLCTFGTLLSWNTPHQERHRSRVVFQAVKHFGFGKQKHSIRR